MPVGGESPDSNYRDLRDSDAYLVGIDAVIELTTSIYKDNNHSYDIGFYRLATLGNQVWYDINKDGIFSPTTELGAPGIPVVPELVQTAY